MVETQYIPQSVETSHLLLDKALASLDKARAMVTKGKEGGHLRNEITAYLDTVEVALRQIEPLTDMLKIVVNQGQTAINLLRSFERTLASKQLTQGDDGSSDTAGK